MSVPTTKYVFNDFLIRYVNYCMDFINLLLQNAIFPIIVFDGADLPIKEVTNNKRKEYIPPILILLIESALLLSNLPRSVRPTKISIMHISIIALQSMYLPIYMFP